MADATLTDVITKLEEVKSAVKGDETTKATAAAAVAAENAAGSALEVAKDTVKKLGGVESAVKSGEVATGAERLAAGEAAAEGARTDAKRMGIFQSISDKLNIFKGMKGDDSKTSGFFGKLLSGFKLGGLVTSFGSLLTTGLSSAFTSIGTLFGPTLIKVLSKLGPIAMIVAGLSMAIKDGITGWMSSENWGVSKISGFLGGFFGGAAKGGIKNAFANAGKFALIGAGAGALIGGPVGAIIGGLGGAVIGGILGFIGGEKLAKGFDGIGAWFSEKFNSLILGPIKAIWDVIAPDWVKSIDFKWSDIFPPALTKLFGGKYFTVDFPEFSWIDLFPKFLVDLFNNIKVAGKDVSFGWKDLLPKFLVKFFAGEYEKEGSFQWSDLLPEFINKIIGIGTTAWAKTEFTWKSLIPNFIVKLIEGTTVTPTGTFSWKDLVPGFIWKLVDGAVAAAKTDEGFVWSNLLPDWMIGAWKSTKGLVGQVGAFDWKALLPKFIADLFPADKPLTIAAGLSAIGSFDWRTLLPKFIADLFPGITDKPLTIAAGLDAVGSWNWMSLFPKWIQDFIDDPTQLTKDTYVWSWKSLLPQFIVDIISSDAGKKVVETASLAVDWWKKLLPSFIVSIIDGEPLADVAKAFTWKSLLPQWMVDVLGTETGKKLAETASLAVDWWKSLLPDWIVNVMEGKSPFAERDTGADEKKIVEAKTKLDESVAGLDMPDFNSMFDMSMIFAPIRDKINELAADASFPMSSVYPHLLKLFPETPIPLTQSAAGGIVGMSPFAAGSMGKAIGLESGGLFTLSQGEMVLDNQAAQTFLKAAQLLTGSQVLEQSRMDGGGGQPVIINNNNVDNSMQSSQTTAVSIPAPTRSNESTLRALQAA